MYVSPPAVSTPASAVPQLPAPMIATLSLILVHRQMNNWTLHYLSSARLRNTRRSGTPAKS